MGPMDSGFFDKLKSEPIGATNMVVIRKFPEPITRVEFASIEQAQRFYRYRRAGYGPRTAAIIVSAYHITVRSL